LAHLSIQRSEQNTWSDFFCGKTLLQSLHFIEEFSGGKASVLALDPTLSSLLALCHMEIPHLLLQTRPQANL
jgi:hypothetical protein